MRPFTFLFLAAALTVGAVGITPARAELPRVVTDIPPVHALVARVMQGVASPGLIVPPGASPHGYALRPSQARALQDSDLVVWIGPDLTPWLGNTIDILADRAETLTLLDAPGTILHAYRDPMADGHDDHEDHDGHDDHDGHAHHGTDPHAWLDPRNGALWLTAIARTLSRLDPENAAAYTANAAAAREDLRALAEDVEQQLSVMQDQRFVAFHDAYQYFEHRFGLRLAGTVTLGDGQQPSPARLVELRARLAEPDIACAFSEPQFNDRLLTAANETGDLKIIELDPVGARLTPGPQLYPDLLRAMAAQFRRCGDG